MLSNIYMFLSYNLYIKIKSVYIKNFKIFGYMIGRCKIGLDYRLMRALLIITKNIKYNYFLNLFFISIN